MLLDYFLGGYRSAFASHLRRNLETLGLKRVSKQLTVLDRLNDHDDDKPPENKQ